MPTQITFGIIATLLLAIGSFVFKKALANERRLVEEEKQTAVVLQRLRSIEERIKSNHSDLVERVDRLDNYVRNGG